MVDKKTNETEEKISHERSKIWVLAGFGVILFALVVGAALVWEREIEPHMRTDLPEESQDTSGASALMPYICDQNPEACEDRLMTFQGEKEGVAAIHPPAIPHPTMVQDTARFEGLENRVSVLERQVDVTDLKISQARLRLAFVIQNVLLSTTSVDDLLSVCEKSSLPEAKTLLGQLTAGGKLTPLSQINWHPTPVAQDDDDSKGWVDRLKNTFSSLVTVKAVDDNRKGDGFKNFKRAVKRGDFEEASRLYRSLDDDQRQAFLPLMQEIRARHLLETTLSRLLMS